MILLPSLAPFICLNQGVFPSTKHGQIYQPWMTFVVSPTYLLASRLCRGAEGTKMTITKPTRKFRQFSQPWAVHVGEANLMQKKPLQLDGITQWMLKVGSETFSQTLHFQWDHPPKEKHEWGSVEEQPEVSASMYDMCGYKSWMVLGSSKMIFSSIVFTFTWMYINTLAVLHISQYSHVKRYLSRIECASHPHSDFHNILVDDHVRQPPVRLHERI